LRLLSATDELRLLTLKFDQMQLRLLVPT